MQELAEIRLALLEAQRRELLRRREDGQLRDADLRALQRELDHEERLLARDPPALAFPGGQRWTTQLPPSRSATCSSSNQWPPGAR